ncbi:hypothetical protein EDD86DRAFT_228520 [Gorgonomyces haynaldii]|nr:hypothetical protein EDD86DRAFT_228520 [Gorgonomyces haynaldii]
MSDRKFKFTWAEWGRLQVVWSALFILTGGIISLWYPNRLLAVAMCGAGALMLALEYPVPFLKNVPKLYYLRALLYLGIAGASMLQAPTHTGGLCLLFGALTYLRAGVNGEPWPTEKKGRS